MYTSSIVGQIVLKLFPAIQFWSTVPPYDNLVLCILCFAIGYTWANVRFKCTQRCWSRKYIYRWYVLIRLLFMFDLQTKLWKRKYGRLLPTYTSFHHSSSTIYVISVHEYINFGSSLLFPSVPLSDGYRR